SDRLADGPLPTRDTVLVLAPLRDGVGYAHAHGVVDRGIKPDNVIVNQHGRVKLTDCGIAHLEDSVTVHATKMGAVLGTPGYMSPEQATGSPIDGRSDLFSIGAMGYEMLTGANPFGAGDGSSATTLLYRIVHEPVPVLPESATAGLPADLRPAIMAALAKDPANRPQNAASFKAMLHGGMDAPSPESAVLTGYTGQTQPLDPVEPKSSNWVPYVVVAALGILLMVALFATTCGSSGGGGGSAATPTGSATSTTGTEGTAATTPAGVYLTEQDGYVAIVPGSAAEPIVTDLALADMDDQSAAYVRSHAFTYTTVEEAQATVDKYIADMNAAKQRKDAAAQSAALQDAQDAQRQAEEEKAAAEEAARAAEAEKQAAQDALAKAEEEKKAAEDRAKQAQTENTAAAAAASGRLSPFWGIWFGASKDEAEAKGIRDAARNTGLQANVYLTTDWANLNSDPWYVVAAGPYVTENEANDALPSVQNAGYPDAYVKYSGERVGNTYNSLS
ncbi:MAG: protein kinase, partial [Eggerthellaceae bacterium]|nr:protein kinase [Eggerthellaceae bacterium]